MRWAKEVLPRRSPDRLQSALRIVGSLLAVATLLMPFGSCARPRDYDARPADLEAPDPRC